MEEECKGTLGKIATNEPKLVAANPKESSAMETHEKPGKGIRSRAPKIGHRTLLPEQGSKL